MIRRLWLVSRVLRREFRRPVASVTVPTMYLAYRCLLAPGLIFDYFTRQRDDSGSVTVLIAGAPRSGTTLLHRLLDDLGIGRGTPAWEAIVPSLFWQRLLGPLVRLIGRRQSETLNPGGAHEIAWHLPEVDDLQIFLRHLDSFFLYVYFLSWDSQDHSRYLSPAHWPRGIVARDTRCLALAAARNRFHGSTQTALLKSFTAGFALRSACEKLPGLRIVYISRAPHESLPSSLSMVRQMLGTVHLGPRPGGRSGRRHISRIVDASLALQLNAIEGLRQLPQNAALVVRYEDLTERFEATVMRILSHLGAGDDSELAARVRAQAANQKRWASHHRYSLGEFGLTEDEIRRRFAAVYDYFGH